MVFSAATLEDVEAAEGQTEHRNLKTILAALCIRSFVVGANAALSLLKPSGFNALPLDSRQVRHIIAYGRGTLGDNAVTIPAIYSLHAHFAHARLTAVVNGTGYGTRFAAELFSGLPYIDEVRVFECDPVIRSGPCLKVNPDVATIPPCDLFVNFSGFGNSGWLGAVLREMYLARRLRAKWVLGFRVNSYNRRWRCFNVVQHHFVKNEPRRPSEVLRDGGLSMTDGGKVFPLHQPSIASLQAKLGSSFLQNRKLLVVNPGAKFAVQRWPASRFAWTIRNLCGGEEVQVVLTGTGAEFELCEWIQKRAPRRTINLAGQTSVWELIEILRMARLCISNDTGTMHLAALIGCPLVAVFTTRISPTHWFPNSNQVKVLFAFDRASSYSYEDQRSSPSPCLNQIQVEHVLRAAAELRLTM